MLLFALAFPPVPRRQPCVLLVEDHADTREMYAQFFAGSFEVLQAGDGARALALAEQHRPDAIVTDMSLPGMDGIELVERVRRQARISRIPVVCLSGYSGEVLEARARRAGCNRIVQKPCMPDVLAQAVLQLIAENRDE